MSALAISRLIPSRSMTWSLVADDLGERAFQDLAGTDLDTHEGTCGQLVGCPCIRGVPWPVAPGSDALIGAPRLAGRVADEKPDRAAVVVADGVQPIGVELDALRDAPTTDRAHVPLDPPTLLFVPVIGRAHGAGYAMQAASMQRSSVSTPPANCATRVRRLSTASARGRTPQLAEDGGDAARRPNTCPAVPRLGQAVGVEQQAGRALAMKRAFDVLGAFLDPEREPVGRRSEPRPSCIHRAGGWPA